MIPEHHGYSLDLASGLERLRKDAEGRLCEPNVREKVVAAIKKAVEAVSGEVEPGLLKKGKKRGATGVHARNV